MRFNLNSDKAKTVARRRAKQVQQHKKKIAKQQKQHKLAQQKKVKRVQKKVATRASQSKPPNNRQQTKRHNKIKFQFGILEIAAIAFVLLAIPVILFVWWII